MECSCLENPRDGGAWKTAVYGVAQRRTWLKRLSSSSSARASRAALAAKKPPANAGDVRDADDPWVGKIPWRRTWCVWAWFSLSLSFLRFAQLPESVNFCFSIKFEQVSAIISRNFKLFLAPAFVCSPFSTPVTWMFDLLLLYHRSLYLSPWRDSFLPLCWSDRLFLVICLQVHWLHQCWLCHLHWASPVTILFQLYFSVLSFPLGSFAFFFF